MTLIDIQAIDAQAREVHFGRAFLTAIAMILFGIGFMFGIASRALAWTAIAIREGYRAGRNAGVGRARYAPSGQFQAGVR